MGNLQILGLGEGQTAQLALTDIWALNLPPLSVFSCFPPALSFSLPAGVELDWIGQAQGLFWVWVWVILFLFVFFGKSFHCFSSFEFESLSDSVF